MPAPVSLLTQGLGPVQDLNPSLQVLAAVLALAVAVIRVDLAGVRVGDLVVALEADRGQAERAETVILASLASPASPVALVNQAVLASRAARANQAAQVRLVVLARLAARAHPVVLAHPAAQVRPAAVRALAPVRIRQARQRA